jgi:hypothetical protein
MCNDTLEYGRPVTCGRAAGVEALTHKP